MAKRNSSGSEILSPPNNRQIEESLTPIKQEIYLTFFRELLKNDIPKEIPYYMVDLIKSKIAEDIFNAAFESGYFRITPYSDSEIRPVDNEKPKNKRMGQRIKPNSGPGSVIIIEKVERTITADEREEMVKFYRKKFKNHSPMDLNDDNKERFKSFFGDGMFDIFFDAGFFRIVPEPSMDLHSVESDLRTIQYMVKKLKERLPEIVNIPSRKEDFFYLRDRTIRLHEIKIEINRIWRVMKDQLDELDSQIFPNQPLTLVKKRRRRVITKGEDTPISYEEIQ